MNIKEITYELGLKTHRRKCPVKVAGLNEINYKDAELLKEFITEKGKITPKRITGVCSRNQKRLTAAIKRARNIALLSFSEGRTSFEDKPVQSLFNIPKQSEIIPDVDLDIDLDDIDIPDDIASKSELDDSDKSDDSDSDNDNQTKELEV